VTIENPQPNENETKQKDTPYASTKYCRIESKKAWEDSTLTSITKLQVLHGDFWVI